MKLHITYLCYHCITGKQDIAYSYIVDSEDEAYTRFKAESDPELEINDVFVYEISDKEAKEILEEEKEFTNKYREWEWKHFDDIKRRKLRKMFKHKIPKEVRKTMEIVW